MRLFELLNSTPIYAEVISGYTTLLPWLTWKKIEIVNDINNELVTFFHILRTQEQNLKSALIERIYNKHARTEDINLDNAVTFLIKALPTMPAPTLWDKALMVTDMMRWRLLNVQMDHVKPEKFIERWDSHNTVFFVDCDRNPSLITTELQNKLRTCKGKVIAKSSQDDPLLWIGWKREKIEFGVAYLK